MADYRKITSNENLKQFINNSFTDTLAEILNFWLEDSFDSMNGGFCDYVDRYGKRLGTEKGGWLQGRALYIYSEAYKKTNDNRYKEVAEKTAAYLKNKAIDKNGRMFFRYDQEGNGLIQRRYLFTEVFGALGLLTYGKTFGDDEAVSVAMKLVETISSFSDKLEPKFNPEFRKLRGHSYTMIMINLFQQFRLYAEVNKDLWTEKITIQIEELFRFFHKKDKSILLETVNEDGSILDSPEGRVVNPGHIIETAWFLMEEANYRNDKELLSKAIMIFDEAVEAGWDKEYGGLYSFTDCDGNTPHPLEWSMKYWWPHTELVYGALLAWNLTGEKKYKNLFITAYNYTVGHFPDVEQGEWFGYLSREGQVVSDVKGNHFKGIFHIPRMYMKCIELADQL